MLATLGSTLPLSPTGSHLLIRLTPEVSQTKGGIHLPESARRLPVSGTVLAVGPGRSIGGDGDDKRTTIWSSIGDEVIFHRADLREIDGDAEHALLLAEDVLAYREENGDVVPENDLVLVEVAPQDRMTPRGIWLPETGRQRAKKGIMLDLGPGRLVLTGPYFGTRIPVARIMGLTGENESPLGKVVYWSGEHAVTHLSQPKGQALVRAGDLMCVEDVECAE